MVKKAHASLQDVQVPRSSDLDNQKKIQAVLASKWNNKMPRQRDVPLDYTNCYGTPETFHVYKWLNTLTSDANVRANVRNDAIRIFLETYEHLPPLMRYRFNKACNREKTTGLPLDKELKGKHLETFKKQRDEFLKTYPKGMPVAKADRKQYSFVSNLCSKKQLSQNVQSPSKRAFLRVLLQRGILDGDRATRVSAALARYAKRDGVGTGAGTSAKVSAEANASSDASSDASSEASSDASSEASSDASSEASESDED
jgi:hypothetical protein